MKIFLASQSLRRKELMQLIGLPFIVKSQEIDETIDHSKDLETEIKRLAYEKAMAINEYDSIVIGADTIVVLDNQIYTKPKDKDDARRMIKCLSNNTHCVLTGVCILYQNQIYNWCQKSEVKFMDLTDEQIEDYINTDEPYDKAGGYAIQGVGSLLIESINGDYYSIMGLPIAQVNAQLKRMIK